MPYAQIDDGIQPYYEFTGPEDAPVHDILCPPDLAPSGLGAWKMAEMNGHIELVEFPDIGHADLVECSDDAVRIVSEFFERALVPA